VRIGSRRRRRCLHEDWLNKMADVEGPPYSRYGPVEFGNGCYAPTGMNVTRRFGSCKACKWMKGVVHGAWCRGCLNCRGSLRAAECQLLREPWRNLGMTQLLQGVKHAGFNKRINTWADIHLPESGKGAQWARRSEAKRGEAESRQGRGEDEVRLRWGEAPRRGEAGPRRGRVDAEARSS